MLFNFYAVFSNNTILSCFFLLIIDSHFLVAAVIAKIFNPMAEVVVPIGIPSKESKAEIEIHLLTPEDRIRKYSI